MYYFIIIDGLLYCCGANCCGQLGLGDKNTRVKLTQLTIPNCKFFSVSNSESHTMAIDENGYLCSCGLNVWGQLGYINDGIKLVLTQVSATQTFQAVSCGLDHTAAIDTDGVLWVCGLNNYGQLGLGNYKRKSSLTKVNDKKIITVNYAAYNTMVVDEDGFLWVCGDNRWEQLGLDSYKEVKILTKVCEQKFMAVISSVYRRQWLSLVLW